MYARFTQILLRFSHSFVIDYYKDSDSKIANVGSFYGKKKNTFVKAPVQFIN